MKGIVIGIQENRAVIIESGGSIREIKNRGYALGQEIVVSRKWFCFPLSIAACLALFLATGIGGYRLYNMPQSYLYIDINPSLRLEINRFDRVLSAVPLNEDAVVLLEQCALDLSNGQGCIDSLIQGSLELGFLNEDNLDVEIDLHTKNKKYMEAVVAAGERISENGISVTVFELEYAQNTVALTNGISASRMRAIESYTEFFGGTFEESMILLAETTSPEIYAQIREYRRSTAGFDKDANTNPQLSGEESKQGGARPFVNDSSTAHTAKRQQAVESYTEYFGGSDEENSGLLESLTIGEIYEKIKSDRIAQHAERQSESDAETTQADTPKFPMEALQRRQQAIESYTEYFGGSVGGNEEKLAGLTIAQIYGAIKNDRTSKGDGP